MRSSEVSRKYKKQDKETSPQEQIDRAKIEDNFPPISELTVLRGLLAEEEVTILKDDGRNTNVISIDFVNKHRSKLDIQRCKISISHFNKSDNETSTEVVWNTELKIGDIISLYDILPFQLGNL